VREEPKQDGYSSTVSTYLDPDGCLIGERWLIHGMNHFWPGGSSDPQWASFTDPKGPNGAEIAWAFLTRYTKSDTAMPCAEAPVSERCKARRLTLRVPRGARAVRARIRGRRTAVRVARGRARVRVPATTKARTVIVVRGRTKNGKPFARRTTVRCPA
jgi:hypothetical protein